LTSQFTERRVRKRYFFLTDRPHPRTAFTVKTGWRRAGAQYAAIPMENGVEHAETRFEFVRQMHGFFLWAAEPVTGRTHQIRVHARAEGIPVLGDSVYGGNAFPRVCLHAQRLEFTHPESGSLVKFESEPAFFEEPSFLLRRAIIEPELTNAFRRIHGEPDGHPMFHVEQWGAYLLATGEGLLDERQIEFLRTLAADYAGAYHKKLDRRIRQKAPLDAAPVRIFGAPAPEFFECMENGIRFRISFQQGYSPGLFLDQRDNRRRILRNYVAPGFELFADGLQSKQVLNTFAYTCGFSVCAALAGASTASLDLSRKYLDWGKENFAANKLDPAEHDFIYGDVFEWVARLAKKQRVYDMILLDPPTFSHAKHGGMFQAEKDYEKLVSAVLPLLKPNGILFASSNARTLGPEEFLARIRSAFARCKRRELQMHYVPQPIDFPISREEPAHLKTAWFRVSGPLSS
jgi:23S rRNA (cytosine1962-C5)-methyltransferase